MTSFTIRQATLDDVETLGHIGVATFVESYTTDIDGPAMMAHCTSQHSASVYQSYLAAPRTGGWIAQHKITGAPIGYALNCTPDLPIETEKTDIELKRIYALSKYHGKGVAGALMQAASDHARSQGATRLLLGTYEDNQRAMAFYAKFGFTIIGTRKFNIGGQIYDDIIMAKSLN